MTYFSIILCIALLIGIANFFLSSLKNEKIPANAQLLVDAWNSLSEKR
ncbi:MAG: hypothetical protein Q3M24_10615 [Candidatus Electrothrix aestuarii]|uniref:Uncharacterized protein n=1 Tax=Candidatus Electrothrix aestuarii TaxID=3062594 RepID=A0AAU8M1Y0_9BACT|nr:hypothetical protein [Candidatus Electrothrix aestuarii]